MIEKNDMEPILIAFYLPQFHPIPENNEWHGEGFTEWTNVGKARPLFKNHYQPRVPSTLGYYDLRVEDVRIRQAAMAAAYGIDCFCYWHYWFGDGKRLLEMPINEVLKSGKPDFPFCFAWANDSWSGVWHGTSKGKVLIEQKYPGRKDYEAHFYSVLDAFRDPRYLKVDNKPLFMIYKPLELPSANEFIDLWQNLAIQNGLEGIYFVGQSVHMSEIELMNSIRLDAINIVRLGYAEKKLNSKYYRFLKRFLNLPRFGKYADAIEYFIGEEEHSDYFFPTIIPNWDHSPRSGTNALILHDSTPELFEKHLVNTFKVMKNKGASRQIAFVKSWNEWAEGNYLEPDVRFGKKYLEVLKNAKNRYKSL